ncbi:HAD family hydrolase [Piscinibacter sp.]|uniref:HAD family hydrolase n=1 Tax=Piscinibacter sp. TaxID=1903157 RepID=UPI002BED36DC|nr:HAD family phosphatase [Albitalea sp.]HUG23239.1 HAD family phosphatase [Albitalea sp.]
MNVVFDFGGVLFRWQPHEFMARLLPHRAPNEAAAAALVTEFFQSFGGDWGEFDRGTVDAYRLAQRIAWRTRMELADVEKVIAAVPHELQPMPQTVALLARLRERGHRLFFLSNMPAPYADHLESAHDFVQWFEDGVFSSRVNLSKPEPAIYHEAARRFGVAPNELLFIDDYALNVTAARALGWQALHFLSGEQCEADLSARGLI